MRCRLIKLSLFSLMLVLFAIAGLFPAQASDNVHAAKVKTQRRDNSGRKLALIESVGKKEAASTNPASERGAKSARSEDGILQALSFASKKLSDELQARNIPIRVPTLSLSPQVESSCNDYYKACKGALSFVHEHTAEVSHVFGRYMKQLVSPPRVTPCASPYLMEDRVIPPGVSKVDAQLYLTQSGRVKTIITTR